MKAPAFPQTANESPQNLENSNKESSTRRSTVVRHSPTAAPPIDLTSTVKPIMSDQNGQAVRSNGLVGGIEGLSLVRHDKTNGHVGDGSADSAEETHSHLSNSSTKPHSLDGKSVASATTFAMDEKESILPDDSASVRAVDDEDGASIIGRSAPFAQEADVVLPAHRVIMSRAGGTSTTTGQRRFHTLINPPRFGDLEIDTPGEITASSAPQPDAPSATLEEALRPAFVPIPPDERLLDALASHKDRLPILQLEDRLLSLLKQTEMQFIDLPPQNSYARLLAHKLADYYGLMHHITEDGLSVRIFRTPEIEIPMTLATLAKSIPVGPAPPPGPTAVKIMRRMGLNDSTAPSSSASKATSDAGHSEEGLTSPTDSTPNRDKSKMTREEREAQYKAVRERIFGDFQELSVSESNSTGENSASMSRSSSSSGKKKNRRQKTPKDDSFEARSAFVPSYMHNHSYNSQPSFQAAQYVETGLPDLYDSQANFYASQMNYGTTPTQSHPGFDSTPNVGMMDNRQQYNAGEPWPATHPGSYYGYPPAQQAQSVYPAVHQTMSNPINMNQQYGGGLNGMQQQPAWPPNQFNSYQPHPASPTSGLPWNGSANFGYGQHFNAQNFGVGNTVSPNGQANHSNHSNRSLFNPQTRSFVPSNPASRTGSRNNNRKKPPSSTPPSQPQARATMPMRQPSGGHQSGSLPFPSRSNFTTHSFGGDNSEETLQKKYGTPANLPKKPPPSQVQQHFDHGGLGVRTPTLPTLTGESTGSVVEAPPTTLA